jgi:hypothetical protein
MIGGRRALALAAILALAACQPRSGECTGLHNCLSATPGVVLGGDPALRIKAQRDLRLAAATYAAWLGRDAPRGAVVLDAAARGSSKSLDGMSWRLTYDATMREALAAAGEGSGPSLDRPGVLAHEICHKYASLVFRGSRGEDRTIPDMLDEVAAVSCETQALRDERLDDFSRYFGAGGTIPWRRFLLARHPLKASPAMMAAVQSLQASGKATVTFDLKQGSSSARDVGLFYGQAAAFIEFVKVRSCRGQRAIGELLVSYEPGAGLDPWLRAHGAALCLPTSEPAFARSFAQFMAARRREGRAKSA